jgi:hypothetical protein
LKICERITNADVFGNRLELREDEYHNLLKIKQTGTIAAQQDER